MGMLDLISSQINHFRSPLKWESSHGGGRIDSAAAPATCEWMKQHGVASASFKTTSIEGGSGVYYDHPRIMIEFLNGATMDMDPYTADSTTLGHFSDICSLNNYALVNTGQDTHWVARSLEKHQGIGAKFEEALKSSRMLASLIIGQDPDVQHPHPFITSSSNAESKLSGLAAKLDARRQTEPQPSPAQTPKM